MFGTNRLATQKIRPPSHHCNKEGTPARGGGRLFNVDDNNDASYAVVETDGLKCDVCLQGKMRCCPFVSSEKPHATRLLELVHSDVGLVLKEVHVTLLLSPTSNQILSNCIL